MITLGISLKLVTIVLKAIPGMWHVYKWHTPNMGKNIVSNNFPFGQDICSGVRIERYLNYFAWRHS